MLTENNGNINKLLQRLLVIIIISCRGITFHPLDTAKMILETGSQESRFKQYALSIFIVIQEQMMVPMITAPRA